MRRWRVAFSGAPSDEEPNLDGLLAGNLDFECVRYI